MISTTRSSQEELDHVFDLLHNQDPEALEHLWKYAPAMEYSLAVKFRHIIVKDDLTDIVRDAIIQAFIKGKQFDHRIACLKTWLNSRAHYQALTFLRKRMDVQSLDDLAYNVAVESVLQSMSASAPSKDIEDLFQFIPPRQAQMLREYYYEEHSYAEIAHRFQLKEETVRVEMSRGRDKLRKLMME